MKRIGIVVAVVVALVAATLAGVWLGTRNGTTSSTTTATTTSSTPTPTTSRAGEIPVGTVTAGEGGTLPGPGALKLGYAHTPDGAVAALTNYLTAAFDKTHLADPAYRAALVNAVALDESSKPGLTRVVDYLDKSCTNYAVCQLDARRGAYAVRSASGERVEVAVWVPYRWASPVGSYKPLTTWGIATYAVAWTAGDWKVASLAGDLIADDSTADLPMLANPEGNPSSSEKATVLFTARGGSAQLWALAWKEYANAIH